MKLVINRSEWWRGRQWSLLVQEKAQKKKKKYCCLGLLGRQLGLSDKEMENYGFLSTCIERTATTKPEVIAIKRRLRPIDDTDSLEQKSLEDAIIGINDSVDLFEGEREERLKTLFDAIGVEVSFQ